jgi:ADP-ribose pyrophosphatase YjhB (NUDIX family)
VDHAGIRGGQLLTVAAAAVVERGRLLVVSKKAAPQVFYLPGGKPEPGESVRQALARELAEELGVIPVGVRLLGVVNEVAAIERVPMRMTVFTAGLDTDPHPAAELAALGWTSGDDGYAPLLAPAVSRHVIPLLRGAGRLPG